MSPRTNCLVHGRIYPDDADQLVRTAPPTPEAIVNAQMTTTRGRMRKGTYAQRVAYIRNEREIERTIRDAVALLRTRFTLTRR